MAALGSRDAIWVTTSVGLLTSYESMISAVNATVVMIYLPQLPLKPNRNSVLRQGNHVCQILSDWERFHETVILT